MLVTNSSALCIVISGRLAVSAEAQLFQNGPGYLLGSRISGRQPDRLRQKAGGNPIGYAFQETPDERPANAEAHHEELVDPQMIHQAELVVGIGLPRPLDLDGPVDWPFGALRSSDVMQRYSPLNSSISLKGELPVKKVRSSSTLRRKK
jgi:hypothetical protein